MNLSLKDIDINNVTYYDLNNRVNIPLNGQIQLDQDKAALSAFFKENVIPNTMTFASLKERFDYLLDNNYLETQFIQKYEFAFVRQVKNVQDSLGIVFINLKLLALFRISM